MLYEWIIGKDSAKWEVNQAYNKYLKARKSTDSLERKNWFEYWLDYLQKKHKHNERSINRI